MDFNLDNNCTATVHVSAYDDEVGEGDHFVNIRHDVKHTNTEEDILLSDGSPLLAPNVLVQIYDNDIAGVIIEETNGITATAEIRDEDKIRLNNDTALYEDEYSLRLTKEPDAPVNITLFSIPVMADVNEPRTKLIQVKVNDRETDFLIFDSTNWNVTTKIRVSAIDDNEAEGVDFMSFASQPSNLGRIQGPVKVSGGLSPNVPPITDPVMLPQEESKSELSHMIKMLIIYLFL